MVLKSRSVGLKRMPKILTTSELIKEKRGIEHSLKLNIRSISVTTKEEWRYKLRLIDQAIEANNLRELNTLCKSLIERSPGGKSVRQTDFSAIKDFLNKEDE